MKYGNIAIIGTGLIGGSIGKALISRDLAGEIIGVCRRESSKQRALKEKAVTKCYVNNYEEALKDADMIIICTPVETVKEILKQLSRIKLKQGAIVSDVGSTKKDIVEFASSFKNEYIFVGTHPLAGSEKAGVEYSSETLFENSVCILTETDHTAKGSVEKMKDLWQDLGARVEILKPEEHDLILAYTSHLPHVAAYALAGAEDKSYAPFASTGFKDTTRIASSDPLLWAEIFMSNKENVLRAIETYRTELEKLEEGIKKGDEKKMIEILERNKRIRNEIVQE